MERMNRRRRTYARARPHAPAPGCGRIGCERINAVDEVPYSLRIAAAWSWRLGLVILVVGVLVWLLSFITLLVVPLMVAGLLAGLLHPVTRWLKRRGMPNGAAVAVTFVGFLVLVAGSLSMVGRQLVVGFANLWQKVIEGVVTVQVWLSEGPLHLTTAQIDSYIREATEALQDNSDTILRGALSFGSTASHLAAGTLLTLFALIFFLLEGGRIWAFIVRLLPLRVRRPADGAGRRGWTSMVNYVRIQMFVAFVDAVGIGVGAALIGVPLALPLGVLVFLGSFVPIVGALVTGLVAVLLALVANGWVNALIMLGIVMFVQQVEGHVLQPLVMGKAVSLHPLAVVLAVAGGTLLAGIPGALFSVPLLAITNTVVRYIAGRQWETDPVLKETNP